MKIFNFSNYYESLLSSDCKYRWWVESLDSRPNKLHIQWMMPSWHHIRDTRPTHKLRPYMFVIPVWRTCSTNMFDVRVSKACSSYMFVIPALQCKRTSRRYHEHVRRTCSWYLHYSVNTALCFTNRSSLVQRTYYTCSAEASLAAGSSACPVQVGDAGLPFAS